MPDRQRRASNITSLGVRRVRPHWQHGLRLQCALNDASSGAG